ncbi:Hsp70 family protein [Dictyobacter kobayashii]|uniref:Molecular chaperone DnaK n=1 Tax=Dictyobacter kobayashii TaxID=2014872 RepID=A0A402AV24_9CHLR|nr:Hsp70 family protein [Dictyobacter kobayashii]GCE22962.1 molecular chaperone DnaK [Dictyobacter kobayashii]
MTAEYIPTIFGIDLGTTYSCISYMDQYGKPVIVSLEDGGTTLPSVVRFEGEQRIVGMEAKNSAVLFPNQVVREVKRHMGHPDWRFLYKKIEYTAEEISSYILRKLVLDAESYLHVPVKDVVITCPAYFGILQRDATVRAGELAGLVVREIINEPTAAAITYGLQNEKDQTILVYDLGGGTFDTTVITVKAGEIAVVATGGDDNLGGRNWDEALLVYLAEQWQALSGSDSDPTDSPESLQDLWSKAEVAKITLSSRLNTTVTVTHEGKRVSVPLSREKFASLTSHLLEKTIKFTQETMYNARMRDCEHYDQIILVGGSTRMPQVAERLTSEFNIPLRIFEPDTAVAKGAAIYGYKLFLDEKIAWKLDQMGGQKPGPQQPRSSVIPEELRTAQAEVAKNDGMPFETVKKFNEMTVSNVTSHSFGVIVRDAETHEDVISNIIMINDTLPMTESKTFYTTIPNQEVVEMKIVENTQFEHRVFELAQGQEVGKVNLHLPPRLPVQSPIEVSFTLERDGRLSTTAREPKSNRQVMVDIQTDRVMSSEQYQAARQRSSGVSIS